MQTGVGMNAGAGKTSVINTIFRLMELDEGTISVDGVNIAKLGLAQLRNAMAIIPQASGTLESSLVIITPTKAETSSSSDPVNCNKLMLDTCIKLSPYLHMCWAVVIKHACFSTGHAG